MFKLDFFTLSFVRFALLISTSDRTVGHKLLFLIGLALVSGPALRLQPANAQPAQ